MKQLKKLGILTCALLLSGNTTLFAQMPEWVNTFGSGNGRAFVNDIQTDALGNIYTIGSFDDYVYFEPQNPNSGHESNGGRDIFFAKYSSTGALIWVNTIGGTLQDEGRALALDNAGTIYITGSFRDSADFDPSPSVTKLGAVGNTDVFMAKYDNAGNLIWAKSMGGNLQDEALDIKINSAGNIVLSGYFNGTADFDPSPAVLNLTSAGSGDIFLASYDSNGNILWANGFGDTGWESGKAICLGAGDTIFMTGKFSSTVDFDPSGNIFNLSSAGGSDIYLAKYTPGGSFVWAFSLGAASSDEGTNLCYKSSNVYLTGTFRMTVDFDPSGSVFNLTSGNGGNNYDAYIAAYNAMSGSFVHAIQIGGSNTVWPNDIAAAGNGDIYITGEYMGTADFDPSPSVFNITSQGGNDIFLAAYTPALNFINAFGTGNTSSDDGRAVAINNNTDVLMGGYFTYDVDFDPSGNNLILDAYVTGGGFLSSYSPALAINWAKNLNGKNGGSDVGREIKIDSNGDIIVMGSFRGDVDFDPSVNTVILSSAPNANDLYLAKYSKQGSLLWVKSIAISGASNTKHFFLDAANNIYIAGRFSGTVDLDPSGNTYNITSNGSDDGYIAKYTNTGDFVWGFNLGGTSGDAVYGISIDNAGDVVVTGYIRGTVDFDPSGNVFNVVVPSGSNQLFWAKYTSAGAFVWAKAIESSGCGQGEGHHIVTDATNSIYITGRMACTTDFDPSGNTNNLVSNGGDDAFLAKYNSSGDYEWAFNIGGTSTDMGYALSISNNKVFVGGSFRDLVDFDPSLNVSYQLSNGLDDAFLAAYDLNGNYLWSKGIGGSTGNDRIESIYADINDNISITGYIHGQADFNPMSTPKIISAGTTNAFIAQYDNSGIYQFAFAIEGGLSMGYSIQSTNTDIYCTGFFRKDCDFDPSAFALNKKSNGQDDIFIAKYNYCTALDTSVSENNGTLTASETNALYQWIDCDTNQPLPGETNKTFTPSVTGNYKVAITKGLCTDTSACNIVVVISVTESTQISDVKMYPNPASDQVFIAAQGSLLREVIIYNMLGSQLKNIQASESAVQVSVSDIPAGVYFVNIFLQHGEKITKKLIVK